MEDFNKTFETVSMNSSGSTISSGKRKFIETTSSDPLSIINSATPVQRRPRIRPVSVTLKRIDDNANWNNKPTEYNHKTTESFTKIYTSPIRKDKEIENGGNLIEVIEINEDIFSTSTPVKKMPNPKKPILSQNTHFEMDVVGLVKTETTPKKISDEQETSELKNPVDMDIEEVVVPVSEATILVMSEDLTENYVTSDGTQNRKKTKFVYSGIKTTELLGCVSPVLAPCFVCLAEFTSIEEQSAHIVRHVEYKCYYCKKKSYISYKGLKNHVLKFCKQKHHKSETMASESKKKVKRIKLSLSTKYSSESENGQNHIKSSNGGTGEQPETNVMDTCYPFHFMNSLFNNSGQEQDNIEVATSTTAPRTSIGDTEGALVPVLVPVPDINSASNLHYSSYRDILLPLAKIKNFALNKGDAILVFGIHELERHALENLMSPQV